MIITATAKLLIFLFVAWPINITNIENEFNGVARFNESFSLNLTLLTSGAETINTESLKKTSHMFEELYKSYAKSLISKSSFSCLEKLWEKESGWNPFAENKSSGAYGIPQSFPGDKMKSKGDDWQTNYKTQINWGLEYIDKRYGNACRALSHQSSKGWY
jgi:hypothetical protein